LAAVESTSSEADEWGRHKTAQAKLKVAKAEAKIATRRAKLDASKKIYEATLQLARRVGAFDEVSI